MQAEENRPDRAELLAKRDEVRARLEAIERDFRGGLDADAEERAVQLENREVLEEIARVTTEELRAIEARLAQLEK